MTVWLLREGLCGGEEYPARCLHVFSAKYKAERFLKEKGYKLEEQPVGSPLWISESGKHYAEVLKKEFTA